MAKIHWIAYILVGLFIYAFSWKLDHEKFIFFVYAGWAFIFVGIAKLAFSMLKGKKRHVKVSHHKFCQRCGAAMHQNAGFCPRCGARV